MRWENYDLEGVEKALEDGHMITTGLAVPHGLTVVVENPDTGERVALGASFTERKDDMNPDSEGPASLPKALEIAGSRYLGEEAPEDIVEKSDAIGDLFLQRQISYLNISHNEFYEIEDGSGLYAEGETLQEAYEELQNQVLSKFNV